jgi:pre-60S factor REI1
MNTAYSCVNCRLNFDEESNYKLHYKSEHHRYNVKRRLIGLMPLSYEEYIVRTFIIYL